MLVFIILSAIVLLGIILIIAGFLKEKKNSVSTNTNTYYDDNDTVSLATMGVVIIFAATFFAIICGIIVISNCTKSAKDQLRINLKNEIEEINSNYKYLYNFPEENTRLDILEYNASVKSFKLTIEKKQYQLSNPWYNWFINPVYAEFSGNEVSYLK